MRIEDLPPDPYSSDEENDYLFLDTLLDVSVSVARFHQNKSSNTPAKESIKRILRKEIEKKDGYTVLKNVRFGEWKQEKNSPSLPIPVTFFEPSLDQTMLDFEPKIKKNVECKKQPRVVGVFKESVGATIITKQILDLGVNLTVGELLASAPAVEKQLNKAIFEDDAI